MPTFQPSSKHQANIQVYNQSNVPIAGTLDLWVGTLSYTSKYAMTEAGPGYAPPVLVDATMPSASGTFDVVIQLTYDSQKMTYKSDDPVVIPLMAPVLRSYTWVGYYPPSATNWLDFTVYNPNDELIANNSFELAVGGVWVSTLIYGIEGKAEASYRMTFTQPATPGLHSAFLRIYYGYYGAYQVDYDLGKLNVPIPQPTVTVSW